MALELTSIAFEQGEKMPAKYTCDGDNVSPPLFIEDVPVGTISLALIVTDPDVPVALYPPGTQHVHWILFNIPPKTTEIASGATIGMQGLNGHSELGYFGPCPPPQYEPREHRYFFRLYALDVELNIEEGATKEEIISAMDGHVIETAELVGRYAKDAASDFK